MKALGLFSLIAVVIILQVCFAGKVVVSLNEAGKKWKR